MILQLHICKNLPRCKTTSRNYATIQTYANMGGVYDLADLVESNKDIEMSKDCDYGIALWDSKSIGTGKNIKRLHALGKKIIVCIVTEKDNHSIV